MNKGIIILTVIILALSGTLYSQDFKPEIKIGGTVYTGFFYDAGNSDYITLLDTASPNPNAAFGYDPVKNQFETSRNSFYLDRAYINIKASLTPDLFVRLTPDIFSYQDRDNKTQYAYQVKYAYLEYTPMKLEDGSSLGFRLGMIPNNWVPFNEKYYGYRGVKQTFTDYKWTTSMVPSGNSVKMTTSSFFSTADLGVTAKYVFPQQYAEMYLGIYNGNGYRDLLADNRFKDVMVSGFIYPLQGMLKKKMEEAKKRNVNRIKGVADLIFGGFAYLGRLNKGEYGVPNGGQYRSDRFGGMAAFKYNFERAGFITLGGEYSLRNDQVPSPTNLDSTINGGGFSAYLEFNPPIEELKEKLSLLFRYDSFDPNTNKPGYNLYSLNSDNGKQSLFVAGLMFKPAKVLTFGLTYQIQSFEKEFIVKYDGTTTSSIQRLFFNTILDF